MLIIIIMLVAVIIVRVPLFIFISFFSSHTLASERFCLNGSTYICNENPHSFHGTFKDKFINITQGCANGYGPIGGTFELKVEEYDQAYEVYNRAPVVDSITISESCSGSVTFYKDPSIASNSKSYCIELCSDLILPTSDFGFEFFNCVNDCVGNNITHASLTH